MVSKTSLLKISADASLLECKHATQEFIIAADAVFLKAQDLAMLAPLHEMVFGLLEGLLYNWCLLNLDSVEWRCKAEVCQACINLWSLNKQAPWCAEFGKTVMAIELEPTVPVVDLAPTPASVTSLIQHVPSVPYIANPSSLTITLRTTQEPPSQQMAPCNKGKGKVKAMEEDKDEEASLLPPLTEFYERDVGLLQGAKISGARKGDIIVIVALLTTWLINVGTRLASILAGTVVKKCPLLEALAIAKHVKLVQAAKAFLEWQGKLSQFFILESFKRKGKAKALGVDSELMGAK
ncbi:hypothetical protein C0995_014338 [Termitomyces sp. Mi166|nr:hypothetical protein C0995_014338 [Termitomyces sp. Mi166\